MLTSSSVVCVDTPRKTFGQLLKAARERKSLSQPVLAGKIGVTPMMISRYENDRVAAPDTDIVMKLVRVLDLESPEDLGFTGGRPRQAPKLRSVPTGPQTAREAVADAGHYLQYFFKRAGLETEEQQAAAAVELDRRFPDFSTVTPALVDLWLEGYTRSLPQSRSATSRSKRGRGQ
jgi:transcriptional regulator with XRE-family HTH domain